MKSIKLETLKRYLTESSVSKISNIPVVMANYRLHKSWPWGHVTLMQRLEDTEPCSDSVTSTLLFHLRLSRDEISPEDVLVVSADDFNMIQSAMFIV